MGYKIKYYTDDGDEFFGEETYTKEEAEEIIWGEDEDEERDLGWFGDSAVIDMEMIEDESE